METEDFADVFFLYNHTKQKQKQKKIETAYFISVIEGRQNRGGRNQQLQPNNYKWKPKYFKNKRQSVRCLGFFLVHKKCLLFVRMKAN